MHESLAANCDRALPGPAAPPVAERLRRPLQLPHAASSARGLCSRPGSDALPTPTLGNQEAWTTQSPRVIWRRPGRPVRSPHRAAASSAAVPLLRPGRPGPISESKGAGRQAGEGGGPLYRLRCCLSICMRRPKGQGLAQPPCRTSSGDHHAGATKKGQAKEAGGKGRWQAGHARIGDRHTGPAGRRAPQRSTSRRVRTTGRGAASGAAGRSILGAATGRHGWRTAARRESAGAGTAIAQHHAGTGRRSGCWEVHPAASRRQRSGAGHTSPAATYFRERASPAPAPRPHRRRPADSSTPAGAPRPGASPSRPLPPSCYRLLPLTRRCASPAATGPQGTAFCHKWNIHIQFVHRSGVRQSGWPRDWPDTRRGFLSGVKVPATQ